MFDPAHESQAQPFTKCNPRDFSKLRIRDGTIFYKLYSQDGTFVEMTMKDNLSNRLLASWIAIHDRWGGPTTKV